MNVGGGRERSLSLRETTELCRELTGNAVAVERSPDAARRRRAHLPLGLPRARTRCTDWRPRRDARATSSPTRSPGSRDNERAVRAALVGWRHGRRDRHRLGRPGRLRVRRALRAGRATTWSGSRTTCAPTSSARPRRRVPVTAAARGRPRRVRARSTLDIRDADARRARLRRAPRRRSSSSCTRPPSPRTTGPRRDPQTDFARQRDRHAQPARGHAPPRARTRRSSSSPRTRSTATARTGCRSRSASTRLELPRGPPLVRRHRHVDDHRRARRTRCSACRRPPPTCWSRSTAATSACRRSASAAAASPAPTTRARCCTASSRT